MWNPLYVSQLQRFQHIFRMDWSWRLFSCKSMSLKTPSSPPGNLSQIPAVTMQLCPWRESSDFQRQMYSRFVRWQKHVNACKYNSHHILCFLVSCAFTHGNFSEKLVLFCFVFPPEISLTFSRASVRPPLVSVMMPACPGSPGTRFSLISFSEVASSRHWVSLTVGITATWGTQVLGGAFCCLVLCSS